MKASWRKAGYWVARVALWVLRVLVVLAILLVFVAAFGKADRVPDYRLAIPAILLLLVVSFWEYVWQVIKDRSVAIGKEGISLGAPNASLEPEDDGSVRDGFIYLGNYHFAKGDFATAFQFYRAADGMKSSILTCFRCAQCVAELGQGNDEAILQWYDRALWHADGPWGVLRDREVFAEWVRERRTKRRESGFAETLRSDLRAVSF